MEIVCSALTGINKTLKEIDFGQGEGRRDERTFLSLQDFKYKKREKLKQIKVLSPEYFASMKAKQVMDFSTMQSKELNRLDDSKIDENDDKLWTYKSKISVKDDVK